RAKLGQPGIVELDQTSTYSAASHAVGENASALIFACAFADFLNIDHQKYEVAAVTGNSMGWYIALVCAGVLDVHGGFQLINTMGSMGTLTGSGIVGGQVIYPVVNENWHVDPTQEQSI